MTTGIIARESGDHDFDVARQLLGIICKMWEQHCSSHYGFKVNVSPSAFARLYTASTELLQKHFPVPPGPFKRVATLVVMSQMHPIFHFEPELPHDASQRWHAKMTALLIPVGLAKLRVNLTPEEPDPTWQRLDAWCGFPSEHFKLEFLQFLERVETYHWWEKTMIEGKMEENIANRLITDEVVRLINAMTLILEGCYYWNEEWSIQALRLRGKCNDFFDGSDTDFEREFYYDHELFKGAQGQA